MFLPRSRTIRWLPCVLAAIAACLPRESAAQAYTPNRRSTDGTHFPSWERDVDPAEIDPVPSGKPGHYKAVFAVEVGGTPLGVVAVPGGTFAALLQDGSTAWIDGAGVVTHGASLASAAAFPPAMVGERIVAASVDTVALVGRDAVAWSSTDAAPLTVAPAVLGEAGVLACRKDGLVQALDASTGTIRWTANLGADVGCVPAVLPGVAVLGLVSGRVVALDAASGAELWHAELGQRIDALGVDARSAWASSTGASNRTHDVGAFVARLALGEGGRKLRGDVAWKLRTGGACALPPLLLGDLVAFACEDDYVHVIGGRKGTKGWRTDLPARPGGTPLLAGERLDVVLPLTGWVVALQADNGAVMGWTGLPDEDETFVGSATWAANLTVSGTSLGRVVALSWEWDPKVKGKTEEKKPRPGSNRTAGQRTTRY